MAGTSLGARPNTSTPHTPSQPSGALRRVLSLTRTRRNHGVFLMGDELATVYSSRREDDRLGVTMTVGDGSMVLTGSMTPVQARSMARALSAAAHAAEAAQRGAAPRVGSSIGAAGQGDAA